MTPTRLYHRVAVPLDGSERALAAIGPAQRLARLHDAELELVTVVDDGSDPAARLAAGRSVAGRHASTTTLHHDDPAAGLARFDRDNPETLMCLTTRGRHPLAAAVLGSVAQALVTRTSQAVVLVGPACDRSAEPPIEQLVVCLDGTPEGEAILPWATSWGRATNVSLALLHVIYPLVDPEARVPPTMEQRDQIQYLAAQARRLREASLDVGDHLVQDTHPASAIIDRLDHLPRSLVAIATTDRHPVARALVGSTTAEVLRSATAPILVASRPT